MSRTALIVCAGAVFALCRSGSAIEQTVYVAPCGNDAWTGASSACSSPSGPKLNIQAAVNAAASGDTVVLLNGTYTGAGNRGMVLTDKVISIVSQGGASNCTVDLQGAA